MHAIACSLQKYEEQQCRKKKSFADAEHEIIIVSKYREILDNIDVSKPDELYVHAQKQKLIFARI